MNRITALAPSGIDGLPVLTQQALFASAFASVGAAAFTSATVYDGAKPDQPSSAWWDRWEAFSACVLGLTFLTAGRSHFTVPDAFRAIYPPIGTWGFWFLPGSSSFHVAWTGVAELAGGGGLLLGGLLLAFAPDSRRDWLLPLAARAVALLVVCVTPANFYMLSHGATMPGIIEGPLPLSWHVGRFVAQASILSVLVTLSGRGGGGGVEQRGDAPAE